MRLLARHAIRLLGQENGRGGAVQAIRLKATTGSLKLATASAQALEQPEKQVERKVSSRHSTRKVSIRLISGILQNSPLTDTFGRHHTYLRISLTERCNLRCKCSP